jgi:glutamate carboxypeptidase
VTTTTLDDLAALVGCESPSSDTAATARCADLVTALGVRHLEQEPERIIVDGRTHLRWTFGRPEVVLIGHFDTVWPRGTTQRWPFQVDGDRATGPGVFDMKAGIVQLFEALATLDRRDGIAVVLTSDEEVGSTTSAGLIEDTISGARAALILEPSLDGAVKTARKGVATFYLEITGRAAHAGLEPEKGINATVEAAHQILAVTGLGRPELGTTVTPTLLAAGSADNTVPSLASLAVDVRARSVAELDRVAAALAALAPQLPGATVSLRTVSLRPPFEEASSAGLFAVTQRVARELGMGTLAGVTVGGGSDGNLTAAAGVPTLDGLGVIGGHAHAEGEWISLASLPERATLLASLVRTLLDDPATWPGAPADASTSTG